MSDNLTEKRYLNRYVHERLPQLVPGVFEGAPDLPDFTVDQRAKPLREPVYPVN
jgi:hypothetical protein